MRQVRGYTLIEILIVIAILCALVLMAAPLTGGWTASAASQQAEGQMREAVGRAKSVALRNPVLASGDRPVSAICISQANVVTVKQGTGGTVPNCNSAGGEQLWKTELNGRIEVKSGGARMKCVCFNNKGLVTQHSACNSCAVNTTIGIAIGGRDDEEYSIY